MFILHIVTVQPVVEQGIRASGWECMYIDYVTAYFVSIRLFYCRFLWGFYPSPRLHMKT